MVRKKTFTKPMLKKFLEAAYKEEFETQVAAYPDTDWLEAELSDIHKTIHHSVEEDLKALKKGDIHIPKEMSVAEFVALDYLCHRYKIFQFFDKKKWHSLIRTLSDIPQEKWQLAKEAYIHWRSEWTPCSELQQLLNVKPWVDELHERIGQIHMGDISWWHILRRKELKNEFRCLKACQLLEEHDVSSTPTEELKGVRRGCDDLPVWLMDILPEGIKELPKGMNRKIAKRKKLVAQPA